MRDENPMPKIPVTLNLFQGLSFVALYQIKILKQVQDDGLKVAL